ncbi:MAG: TetR family transcriptional regulator [Hamadaea sp.]|nr:TetR family transcriptional regulator [Hamadaea sp.]
MPDSTPAPLGLRERKKARTRQALQDAALRLIRAQGYDATTVDQIAAAAEVSPATFFRYFPTKEDVIIEDEYDPVMIRRWHDADLVGTPVQRIRQVVRETMDGLSADERAAILERTRLIYSVPQLRARAWDNWMRTQRVFAELLGEQLRRPPEDLRIRAYAGAVMGAMLSVFEIWIADPSLDLGDLLDEALAVLDDGL